MSRRNSLKAKHARRLHRGFDKPQAIGRMPFAGVHVRKGDVLGHRYLASRGLNFSLNVAAVKIR